jgi:hypothetical protein
VDLPSGLKLVLTHVGFSRRFIARGGEGFDFIIGGCIHFRKHGYFKKERRNNMKRFFLAALLTACLCLITISGSFAQDAKFEMNAQFGMKEVLLAQAGKRVTVKTDAGETLEGTVSKVGDQLLHISKLTGKDFYDAVIRLDKITSVVLKVR